MLKVTSVLLVVAVVVVAVQATLYSTQVSYHSPDWRRMGMGNSLPTVYPQYNPFGHYRRHNICPPCHCGGMVRRRRGGMFPGGSSMEG